MMPSPPAETIPEILERAAQRWPEDTALEDGDTILTFTELRALAQRAAGMLRDHGIQHGDAVAIWAPNSWMWVVAALGVHIAGGILVPINTRYKATEASYILSKSKTQLLFVADGFLGIEFSDMVDAPSVSIVALDDSWHAALRTARPLTASVAPSDVSDVLFTSGTTGHPKGVVCRHEQTCRAFTDWSDVVGLRHGDRYLVVAPFFHCFGYKAGWLACLIRGATILPQAVFDAEAVLERISADRVSVLPGPPALYQSLLQHELAHHALGTLRLAVTGAASIPVQLIHDMRAILGFQTVITGYGLTEATGIVSMCRAGDPIEQIAKTSGRPIPGVEIRIVDSLGRELPPGEPGEVLVRGYNVMSHYLDDPVQTEATVRAGWLHTGDVGILDAGGNLRITDRIKDMFIVGGFNAYPAEIEHTLLAHPDIREVAVIGVPHDRLGEVGMAFIVSGRAIDPEAMQTWCRARLANFKVPRHYRQVDALPRNASTKVVKGRLRALASR